MRRISDDHWLERCRRVPTPHCDHRPDAEAIDLIVIHGISLPPGQFGSGAVEALFAGMLDCDSDPAFRSLEGVRVSAHLFINRQGSVVQFVPFHRRAWHAGVSMWRGRKNCNAWSIGIELEGTDDLPYTKRQYKTLVAVLKALMVRYPRLSRDTIVGHAEVAPGRKTDPGPWFDWVGLLTQLKLC
ncbi:MAG: 1,6-anhydro-N-acetylmuramyl-L-alanine amidase AmpD [Gammaproteobacteria bacterium]|nr:1,6-anhydro-N-acetylmuramyl-L-alanine amidase AmpD [Gammaproteobacteria bacterium]